MQSSSNGRYSLRCPCSESRHVMAPYKLYYFDDDDDFTSAKAEVMRSALFVVLSVGLSVCLCAGLLQK